MFLLKEKKGYYILLYNSFNFFSVFCYVIIFFRLHPMPKKEQDQLSHLAEMYSLHMQLDDSPKKGVTLTKTEYDYYIYIYEIY